MNARREYKGYVGIFEVDSEADVIHERVVNALDMITFQGKSIHDAVSAFHESVDDYLEFCKTLGRSPEKLLSNVR